MTHFRLTFDQDDPLVAQVCPCTLIAQVPFTLRTAVLSRSFAHYPVVCTSPLCSLSLTHSLSLARLPRRSVALYPMDSLLYLS